MLSGEAAASADGYNKKKKLQLAAPSRENHCSTVCLVLSLAQTARATRKLAGELFSRQKDAAVTRAAALLQGPSPPSHSPAHPPSRGGWPAVIPRTNTAEEELDTAVGLDLLLQQITRSPR